MIWVYAIADRPELPVPRRRGLGRAPLEGVAHGDVVAIVTRHGQIDAQPAPNALWTHERVVEGLMEERAVLPMRFGSVLDGDDELHRLLASREEAWASALARVRGRVELGVRAVARDGGAGAPAPASGREYLEARLGRTRAAEAVHEPLAGLAVEAVRQPTRPGGEVLRAAYLVERDAVGRFRAEVDRLAGARPDLAVLCTGPWPPYAFTDPEPAHEPVAG